MSTNMIVISGVIDRLAFIFRNTNFDYLSETFSIDPLEYSPDFGNCYIAVSEEGDLVSGGMGSLLIGWWEVTNAEIIDSSCPDYENDPTPIVLKIYVEEERFVLRERYHGVGKDLSRGGVMSCIRRGTLAELEIASSFNDIPMIWRPPQ